MQDFLWVGERCNSTVGERCNFVWVGESNSGLGYPPTPAHIIPVVINPMSDYDTELFGHRQEQNSSRPDQDHGGKISGPDVRAAGGGEGHSRGGERDGRARFAAGGI